MGKSSLMSEIKREQKMTKIRNEKNKHGGKEMLNFTRKY